MAFTVRDNIEHLKGARDHAAGGAPAAATAMAKYVAERAKFTTLRRTTHAPNEYHQARPGRPPASASGALAKSITYRPASTSPAGLTGDISSTKSYRPMGVLRAIKATASVYSDAPHARLLEYGCIVKPRNGKAMHWFDSAAPAGGWFHTELRVPPHPYLGPTTEESIQDGELHDAAVEDFIPYDP